MLHEELSRKILQACFEVSNELGIGFLESVYEKALLIALRQKGLNADSQISLKVKFSNSIVDEFYADIIVDKQILMS